MQKTKVIAVCVLITISVFVINYILIFVIPVQAEMYSEEGQHLPLITQLFVDVFELLKSTGLILVFSLIPLFFCTQWVSKQFGDKTSWAMILAFYLIPIACLYFPPVLGLSGATIEDESPSAEELARVPWLYQPPSADLIDVSFENKSVQYVIDEICKQHDLLLISCPDLSGEVISFTLRDVTWRQVLEIILEPIEYTYLESEEGISILRFEELEARIVGVAIPIVGSYGAMAAYLAPLVDASYGGSIYYDESRNALIVFERPTMINAIVEIVERYQKRISE